MGQIVKNDARRHPWCYRGCRRPGGSVFSFDAEDLAKQGSQQRWGFDHDDLHVRHSFRWIFVNSICRAVGLGKWVLEEMKDSDLGLVGEDMISVTCRAGAVPALQANPDHFLLAAKPG